MYRFCVVLALASVYGDVESLHVTVYSPFYYNSSTNTTSAVDHSNANITIIIVPLNQSSNSAISCNNCSLPNVDKKGNITLPNEKKSNDERDTNMEQSYFSIRIAVIPVLILIVCLIIACFVANKRSCTVLDHFPILSFMRAFTNPLAPIPDFTCRCGCRRCVRRRQQRLPKVSSSSDSSDAAPPQQVLVSPTVSFRKRDDQVEIHGLSSDSQSETPDPGSSNMPTSSSSSDDSDSSSGRMTKKERKAFNTEYVDEDSPPVIDINPFDPEYVYAALAPDIQPCFSSFEEDTATTSQISMSSTLRRDRHQQGVYRQPALLETICE